MIDPIEILGIHPHGAFQRPQDPRDFPWDPKEIAQVGIPFDWNVGYDVEAEISRVTGATFKLPTKNQGSSGSCGGQAFSYYGQALAAFHVKDLTERSAKYPYSQVFVTGGGSYDRDLANIMAKQGSGLEADCVSYENGQAPGETFMERPQDITAIARMNASRTEASLAYAFPQITVDSVAQAISASQGLVLGIDGTNNGTWLSNEPKPPIQGQTIWRHFLYAGKATLENGQKKIWVKNSWGPTVGDNGWQKLDEAYFTANAVWGATALLYNQQPSTPPSHKFKTDLTYGDRGDEVFALQKILAYDGEFPLDPTGYYGSVTSYAVLRFQKKYQVAPADVLDTLQGRNVGPRTRAKLNTFLP